MKCIQCGGTKFIKTVFLQDAKTLNEKEDDPNCPYFFRDSYKVDEAAQLLGCQILAGDTWAGMRVVGNCDTYVCEECGHVELFAKGFIEKVRAKEEAERILAEEKRKEEEQLRNDYKELGDFITKLTKIQPKLKKTISNENVTVKEHKIAQKNLNWIERNLDRCTKALEDWEKDPKRYQKEWSYIKKDNDFPDFK